MKVKSVQLSGPDGDIVTTFEYDGIHRLVKVTDADENVTMSVYDMGDLRTEVNHPTSGITSFTYDPLGNFLTKQTDIIFLIVLIVFIAGFLTKDWYVSKRLGSNYIFTSDRSILYQLNDKEYYVVPYGIDLIKNDERWIIATTEGLNATFKDCNEQSNNGTQYWIVDKSKPIMALDSMYKSNIMFIKDNQYPIIASGLIGPLDSLSLNNNIKLLKIQLSF